MKIKDYVAPEITITEVVVENGFALSNFPGGEAEEFGITEYDMENI